MDYTKYCLILHPVDTVRDIITHTGLVRHLYEEYNHKIIYIIPTHLERLMRKHLFDLDEIIYEIVPDFENKSLFKLFMGKFKNIRIRMFFGSYDKFRLDSLKNTFSSKFESKDYDPYTMYQYDESIKYTKFITSCIEKDDKKLINLIKSIANMDYRIFSKSELIPLQYKKNSTIAIHVDKVFNITNFFDSIVLLEKTKYLHLTDTDDFSLFVYILFRSNNYNYLFKKKHIYLFHQNDKLNFDDIPSDWKLIKYIPEIN